MSKTRLGRGGDTVIRDLGDGKQVSFTRTSAGTRANLHEGDRTRLVDPAAYGVRDVDPSLVGGNHRRVTLTMTDNQAIDITQRGDGTLDEQIHTGGSSRKK